MKEPKYLTALQRVLTGIQLPPGYHDVQVLHDSWCAIFKGGKCNCNPEIRLPQHILEASR